MRNMVPVLIYQIALYPCVCKASPVGVSGLEEKTRGRRCGLLNKNGPRRLI